MNVYFGDNKSESDHGRKSLRGGALILGARSANALIQIFSVLFLARLLSPEDYGLVGMVTAITGFAQIFVDLGTRDAVAQQPHIAEGEISALFWITNAVGCSVALLIAVSGPLFSRFYGEPRLTAIAIVSSLTFVTSALTMQHHALLRRAMKFRELSAIDVGANVLSAAGAVTMAFMHLHYWALVLRPIATNFFTAVGLWATCRWLPSRPTFTRGVKQMLKLGAATTGSVMIDFFGTSSDRVAIGYRIGARGLGFYQNALFVYGNLIDVLVGPLHGVAVASLSKVRNDLKELRRLWAKALSTIAFYAMPAFGLLAVTSQDLIVLLLGAKWSASGALLAILALRGIPGVIERTLGWLHVTAGRGDRWMRWGAIATSAQLIALFCGLPYGPKGVVVAYVICSFILFVPAIAYSGRPLNIGASDVVKVIWRPLLGSLGSAAVAFALRNTLLINMHAITRTSALAGVYLAVYFLSVVGLFRVRMPISIALSLIRDAVPSRFAWWVRTPSFIERHWSELT